MYSEEETELRDLIMQNLENCGFLKKIKAELRAGVFLALEEDGNLKNKIPIFNQKFDKFVNTSEGKMIISLIREFLEYFSLNFTLSVFDPEVAVPFSFMSRSELCEQTNLRDSELDGPVISAVLSKVIGTCSQNFSSKSADTHYSVPEKSTSKENMTANDILQDLFNNEKSDHNKEKSFIDNSFEDCTIKSSKDSSDVAEKKADAENSNDDVGKIVSDIFKEKGNKIERDSNDNKMFKESSDMLSTDRDPFFDDPLPSEKKTFFSFSDSSKEMSESKSAPVKRDFDDSKKSSLSSLKDLPSLANEWAFSRDPKNTLPSLDSQKSASSSETSNEEIINLDSKDAFEKKDSDIAESNEESSEKQNSEESIAEEIDESSAGIDDLLASSLSLADDVTTDQTVSQVSVVEGVDHVEPCK